MKWATLGPEGTFSHQAALEMGAKELLFAHTIEDVFDLLEQDLVEKIILPFENSISGLVFQTLQGLIKSPYLIEKEHLISIVHHLASFTSIDQVKKLYTHAHTYEQCKDHLRQFLLKSPMPEDFEILYTTSNALSAKKAAEDKDASAALLNTQMLDIYQMPILKRNMQDHSTNQTRFICIGHERTSSTGSDRTSLMIYPDENSPGILKDCLALLASSGLDLTKIESKSLNGEIKASCFFLEFTGHRQDPVVEKALKQLNFRAKVQCLGSYPKKF